jgi:hypothetical protein
MQESGAKGAGLYSCLSVASGGMHARSRADPGIVAAIDILNSGYALLEP